MGDIGEEIGGALDKTWGGGMEGNGWGGEASILEERKGFKKRVVGKNSNWLWWEPLPIRFTQPTRLHKGVMIRDIRFERTEDHHFVILRNHTGQQVELFHSLISCCILR